VLGRGHDERRELLDELGPTLGGEGRADPDVLQAAALVVQPEQQGPQQRLLLARGLVQPVAGDHDVGGALVLDLSMVRTFGWYGAARGLANTPSSPAASNCPNQPSASAASVVVRQVHGGARPAPPRAGCAAP
jgi:hypothetical protein